MNIFNIFRKPKGTGALIDTRPQEEKDKDFQLSEIVASINPVIWIEKPQSEWRKFPISDQNGSGSCVAQTTAKLLGIIHQQKHGEFVQFSATDVYRRRSNKPAGGMAGVEALNIATEGVTLEQLLPSQKLNDEQMTNVTVETYKEDVGKIFKVSKNFVQLPIKDIDTIASTIQTTGKGVMVWVYFANNGEWSDVPTVKGYVDMNAPTTGRHSITAVDFTLYNGEKALIIDDSWGNAYGKAGQRVLTESFFKERNFFAAYLTNFTFDEPVGPVTPTFIFNKDLSFGMHDPDVFELQKRLAKEGFFPSNVANTYYFGAVTKKAVIAYQVAKNITPAEGYVGPITRTMLNGA